MSTDRPSPEFPGDAPRPGFFARCRPHFIVLIASACLMAVEMVAARLVNRNVGSSIYTWTTVIGVIFAGMSVGNYLGGRLAARWRPQVLLGQLMLLSSFLILVILWVTPALGTINRGTDWPKPGYQAQGELAINESLLNTLAGLTESDVARIAAPASATTDAGAPAAPAASVPTKPAFGKADIDALRTWGEGRTFADQKALADELAKGVPSVKGDAAKVVALLAAPVGPAFTRMRETGVSEASLAAIARPSQIGTGKESTAAWNRRDSDDDEFRTRVRDAVDGSTALRIQSESAAEADLDAVVAVLAPAGKPVPAVDDALLETLKPAGVPHRLRDKVRDLFYNGTTGTFDGAGDRLGLTEGERADAARVRSALREKLGWAEYVKESHNRTKDADVSAIVRGAKEPRLFTFPVRLVFVCALLFFAPSLALGLISPVAAQLAIDTGKGTGRSVGSVYAWGAWGSILGTFATGFFLVNHLGSYKLIAASAHALVLLSLVTLPARLLQVVWLVGLSIITLPIYHQVREPDFRSTTPEARAEADAKLTGLAELWAKLPRVIGETIHLRDGDLGKDAGESDYQFLKVTRDTVSRRDPLLGRDVEGEHLTLSLDHLIHGYVTLRSPDGSPYDYHRAVFDATELRYDYEKVYAVATARALLPHLKFEADDKLAGGQKKVVGATTPVRSIFMGGGTYTFQRYLIDRYPGIPYEVKAGETLVSIAAREYGTKAAPAVPAALDHDAIAKVADAPRKKEDAEGIARRVLRHNIQRLAGVKLGSGRTLNAAAKVGSDIRVRPVAGRDVDDTRPVTHTTTDSDTAETVVAAVYGTLTPDGRAAAVDRLQLDNAAEFAAALLERPLPEKLALELPCIADVGELDPAVTEINYTRLGLKKPEVDPRIETWNYDARNFVEAAVAAGWKGKYHLAYGDAFNHYSVPYHLTTKEFNDKIKELLTPDGAYIALIIDQYGDPRFLSAEYTTFKKTWKHVYIFAAKEREGQAHRETFVIVGSDVPQDYDLLGRVSDDVREDIRTGDRDELDRKMKRRDPDGLDWIHQAMDRELYRAGGQKAVDDARKARAAMQAARRAARAAPTPPPPADGAGPAAPPAENPALKIPDAEAAAGAKVRERLELLLAADRHALPSTTEDQVGSFAGRTVSLSQEDIAEEIVRWGRPLRFGTAVRGTWPMTVLLGRPTAGFELGDDAVARLAGERKRPGGRPDIKGRLDRFDAVPTAVVAKLAELKGQRFATADAFCDALAGKLTSVELARFRRQILREARDEGRDRELVLTDDLAPVDDLLSTLFDED